MKRSILTLLLGVGSVLAMAQDKDSKAASDTSAAKKKTVTVTIGTSGFGKDGKTDTIKKVRRTSGASFDIVFNRFDIGFAKLVDNGSFTLSAANQFLDYKSSKTSNVGFDVIQFGYRFNRNFKVYVAGGFDWTHIRLEKDITVLRDQPVLNYSIDNIEYEKNRLSSTYLRIPLGLDFRTNTTSKGKRLHITVGPEIGFLLGGKVKQVSSENGKQKFDDDYHFNQFRYGAVARVGSGGAGLFVKQYFNDMFENSPSQKGLKNLSFGVMFGF